MTVPATPERLVSRAHGLERRLARAILETLRDVIEGRTSREEAAASS